MKNTGNDRKNGGKQINFISENKSIIPCQKSEMGGKNHMVRRQNTERNSTCRD